MVQALRTVRAEFQVNSTTTSDQGDPAIAANPATGGFQIVWESDGQDGDGLGIFAQDFDRFGKPAGAEFRVNTVTLGDQENPDVAINADGNGAWVWETDAVWVDTVDRDATPRADETAENVRIWSKTFGFDSDDGFYYNEDRVRYGQFDPTQEGQAGLDPRVIALGGDQFATGYLVQELFRGESRYTVDEFSAYVPDDLPRSGQWSRNFAQDDSEFRDRTTFGDVVQLDADTLLVVSTKASSTEGADGVIQFQAFQRSDDPGEPFELGARIEASDSGRTGAAAFPRAAVLEDGGFAITWTELNQLTQRANLDTWVQVFDADGSARTPAILVHDPSLAGQGLSEIAALKDGGFLVTYTDNSGKDGSGTAILAQRFDKTGVKLGDNIVVEDTDTAGNQVDSAIAVLRNGKVVVTWETQVGDLGTTDVHATMFKAGAYGAKKAQILTGHDGNERFKTGARNDDVDGGGGRDVIRAGTGDDRLDGGWGNDRLFGGAGADWIAGDLGNDVLVGNAGRDRFVFNGGRDVLRDFQDDADTLILDGGLHVSGKLNRNKLADIVETKRGDLHFDFGNGDKLIVKDIGSFAQIADDLAFF